MHRAPPLRRAASGAMHDTSRTGDGDDSACMENGELRPLQTADRGRNVARRSRQTGFIVAASEAIFVNVGCCA